MMLGDAERMGYFSALRRVFGDGILADETGLDASRQRATEEFRQRMNRGFVPASGTSGREPKRLLVTVTQRCTFHCSHCWLFASPEAELSLSLDELDAIDRNTSIDNSPSWTVSGGEFFTLPHFAEVLRRYPIDCVYTNGFWGFPAARCSEYIDRIAEAVAGNTRRGDRPLTLILSYDSFHAAAAGTHLPLATAIAGIVAECYRRLPAVAIRISHAQRESGDTRYLDVVRALESGGFSVAHAEAQERNGRITVLAYRYWADGGAVKQMFVDTYPVTAICRALLDDCTAGTWPEAPGPGWQEQPRARHQYTVGPEGGLGLYEVLYAPPVPYLLADVVHERWSVIEERIIRDPIAVTLQSDGAGPVMSFLDRFYPALARALAARCPSVQAFLHLAMLDPERRLLLNSYLADRLLRQDRLRCVDPGLASRLSRDIDALYGVVGGDGGR
jgi:hypothetical protein